MKVSVIVPIYKVEKYLCQCIDSIINQTLKDIEIILIDEGDMDECRTIIDMYEFGTKKDSRVKSVHERNGGYGASVNKGIDLAQGEYISIIESDDFIKPEMLEEMYNYAKNLDADVVKTPYFEYWDKNEESPEKINLCFWKNDVKNVPENETFKLEEYPCLTAIHPSIWSVLYKTSFLKEKEIKCLEAKGAGYIDNHFRLHTLLAADKIAWLNKPFYYYRLSNAEASQASYNIDIFLQRWSETHKLFEEKFPLKWDKIASFCLIEECRNSLRHMRRFNKYFLSRYSLNLLIDNISRYTPEQIEKCFYLRPKERKLLLYVNKLKNRNKFDSIINLLKYNLLFNMSFLEIIFSLKNEKRGNKKHKVITILGMKLKIKLRNKS